MSPRFLPLAAGWKTVGAALFAIALIVPARADIQQYRQRNAPRAKTLRNVPPDGLEQSVQVNVGGQVEIVLQSHGQEGKTITFLPREMPAHGRLGDLHLLSHNSASITYSQDPGDVAESDQFTYAVQARGSVVSSPVTVSIQIVPLPAHLVVTPSELDFGAVNVGATSRVQVTVENRGGATATGELMAPSPWAVEGSPQYSLGKGERQTFQLVFKPGGGRAFDDELVLGGQADQRAHLVGTGIGGPEPLKLEPMDQVAASAGGIDAEAASGSSAADPTRSALATANPVSKSPSVPALAPSKPLDLAAAGLLTGPVGAQYSLNPDSSPVNDAVVDRVDVRWHDSHTIKLAWKTPNPPPKGYHVELRYLSIEPGERKLNIVWRAYAQVEYQPGKRETDATLSNLPAGTRQTIRVVALDAGGRASTPSPMLQVELPPTVRWLRITPLRVMLAALGVCLFLAIKRRRDDRQILASITASRAPEAHAEAFG